MPISIRPLTDSDLGGAEEILRKAFQRAGGWQSDLHFYRKVQPDGYFLALRDGQPVGMVGTTIYPQYAYVGLMAVLPACQHQGIGAALMEYLLAWLDQRQVTLVLLDASPAGQPLYERLGFIAYQEVEIFEREAPQPAFSCPPNIRALSELDLERISALDADAFGADRRRVLRLLQELYPGRAFLAEGPGGRIQGYLFAQQHRIGPWVMQEPGGAEELLRSALALPFPGPTSVAVPEENPQAAILLKRYGFNPVRINRHMGRGSSSPVGDRLKVFGQTSLAVG